MRNTEGEDAPSEAEACRVARGLAKHLSGTRAGASHLAADCVALGRLITSLTELSGRANAEGEVCARGGADCGLATVDIVDLASHYSTIATVLDV